MGKSIDPGKSAGAAPKQKGSQCNPAPPPIGSMSLQLAIPGQVGLHQSLSPLHQPRSSLPNNQQNEYKSSTNGELSNPNLSHGRGSPQPLSSPASETFSYPFPDQRLPPVQNLHVISSLSLSSNQDPREQLIELEARKSHCTAFQAKCAGELPQPLYGDDSVGNFNDKSTLQQRLPSKHMKISSFHTEYGWGVPKSVNSCRQGMRTAYLIWRMPAIHSCTLSPVPYSLLPTPCSLSLSSLSL